MSFVLQIRKIITYRKLNFPVVFVCVKSLEIVRSSQVKSSQVCFIVNSATCTAHTYRELKLRNSQTLGAYS